ncbi:kinase-like protein [Coemansia reversa NRRL 1564]|uniref:Kinase-like protein n=1 Tax=Coemansia reversa (strain ATCC 12441 / NRRL 1564) TaxID=763665 RepID=A0A2G5B0K7_COERN|nr:kinase-like protein [Coemansia reversa NRRL 1564]|eukprot:PIA12551.1 kinase-like protein [Coemansia reversa NRRL 1564]
MDEIIYKGFKFIPEFNVKNLSKDKLYIIRNPNIQELKDYTVPIIQNEDNVEELFSKTLYSYHEVKAYEKLKGLNVAPEMKGISKIQGCYVIHLEKMEPLKHYQVNNKIIKSLITKVEKMHSAGIIHRDLRMNNLLYKKGDVFICDFEDKGYSPEWAAPEVLEKLEFSIESDIYSLGCTIYEMITNKRPWNNDEEFESKVINKNFSSLLSEIELCEKNQKHSNLIKNIIHDCLYKRCVERKNLDLLADAITKTHYTCATVKEKEEDVRELPH